MNQQSFINLTSSNQDTAQISRQIQSLQIQKQSMTETINRLNKKLTQLTQHWQEYLNYPRVIKKLSREIVKLGKIVVSQDDQIQELKINLQNLLKQVVIKSCQKVNQNQFVNKQKQILWKQQKILELQQINQQNTHQLFQLKQQNILLQQALTTLQQQMQEKNQTIHQNNKTVDQLRAANELYSRQLIKERRHISALQNQINSLEVNLKKGHQKIDALQLNQMKLSKQNRELLEVQKDLLKKIEDLENSIKSQQSIIEQQQNLIVNSKNDENLDEKIILQFQMLLNRFKLKLVQSQEDLKAGLSNLKKEIFNALQIFFKKYVAKIQ